MIYSIMEICIRADEFEPASNALWKSSSGTNMDKSKETLKETMKTKDHGRFCLNPFTRCLIHEKRENSMLF